MDNEKTTQLERLQVPPGMSWATAKLIDLLKDGKPGESVLTDERMTAVCEKSTEVGGNGYGNLGSAIRYCVRNYGLVWQRVVGENCIQCLNDPAKLILVDSRRQHVHRSTNRAGLELGTISPANLSDEDRTTFHATLAQIGGIKLMSSAGTRKKLIQQGANHKPELAKLLPLFSNGVTN